MWKLSLWYALTCAAFIHGANAQSTPEAAPSSNLSGTQRLASDEVDLFRGQPQITFPLFSKNYGVISTGISLNYFPGGVRVEEYSSSVGLSWAFNAGGTVVRTARSLPDDHPTAGYRYLPDISPNMSADDLRKYGKDSLDGEADLFTFNAGKISGKFYIGKDGSVFQIPQSKMKIVPQYSTTISPHFTLSGFEITDEEGVKYEFKEIETMLVFDPTNTKTVIHDKHIASAWHLTKITDPFERLSITFQYISHSATYYLSKPDARTLDNLGSTISESGGELRQEYVAKRLSQINLPYNQKVKIEYKEGLENYDMMVNNINIYDNDVFCSGFHLEYYYTSCYPDDVNKNKFVTNAEFKLSTLGVSLDRPATTRIFLRRIIEKFPNAVQQPTTFYYNEEVFLPSRKGTNGVAELGRHSQDHWGFYNGATNSTLIPGTVFPTGGNREHNEAFVKAGSLKKIVFPGGGAREFEFEGHDRLQLNTTSQHQALRSMEGSSIQLPLTQYYSTQHMLELRMDRVGNPGAPPPFTGTCDYTLQIKNGSGTVVASRVISLFELYYSGMIQWELNLPNGTYTMHTSQPMSCSLPGDLPINVNWSNTVVVNYKAKGGGLRIKKITDQPGNGQPAIIQEFRYLLADGTSSSGYVGLMPKYDYGYIQKTATTTNSMRVVQSAALNNLNFVASNPVGYSRVEVVEGMHGGANIGRTIYEFTGLGDIKANQGLFQYPFVPAEIADWGLGLVKSVTTKDANGATVKQLANTFRIIEEDNTSTKFKSLKLGTTTVYANGNRDYFNQWYSPRTGRAETINAVETRYYKDGSQNTSTTTYEYNPNNYRVSKVTKDLDKTAGKKIENRYYYTTDYNFTSGAIKILNDKGIIVKVASEEWMTGGGMEDRLTGGNITEFTQVNSLILPFRDYYFKGATPVPLSIIGAFNPTSLNRRPQTFETTTEYTRYDADGFLIETKDPGGRYNSIIWGGDKQPIAKVTNAAYAQIAHSSFEVPDKGNWTYVGSPVADPTAPTGRFIYNLASGQIQSQILPAGAQYYFSFWSKGGTPSVTGATLMQATVNSFTGWTRQFYKSSGGTAVTVAGTGFVDELRIFPAFAQMSTAVTIPFMGVISETNPLGQSVSREFDRFNRVAVTRDDNKHVVSKMEYGFTNILHTNPIWEFTENKRCQSVAPWGITGYLELEQMDVNPNSSTFFTIKWILSEKVGCLPQPVWQATGQERCLKMSNGDNTGYYEIEESDVNPHSNTFGVKRWINGGYNRTKCPDLCIGTNKKIVNGVCEIGVRTLVRNRPNGDDTYTCFWVYKFSDGTQSAQFTTQSNFPCDPEL